MKKIYDYKLLQTYVDNDFETTISLAKRIGCAPSTLGKAQRRGDIVFPTSQESRNRRLKKGITTAPKMSLRTRDLISKSRSKYLHHIPFYSKRCNYKGISLDSSFELIVAKELDKHGISWTRPKFLIWMDNRQKRRYFPDFYLPDFDVYLDPKNDYLIKKDKRKLQLVRKYNKVKVLVLSESNLTWDKIQKVINIS
ncbi:MAG: hypothetical protein V3U54_11680 [Thermodesulfobacteriota bacterium]